MPRTRIKICGLTSIEDALLAIELGADAVGFIRVPESPRFVDDAVIAQIHSLPPFVNKVILIKNTDEVAVYAGIESVMFQHYSEGDSTLWEQHSKRHIRAFRMRDEESLTEMVNYPFRSLVSGYQLDAYHKTKLGGSGETFDWQYAVTAKKLLPEVPIVLAGGLTPENIGKAIRTVRPFAVDVSSGLESEVGRKCPTKLAAFFDAVRQADEAFRISTIGN